MGFFGAFIAVCSGTKVFPELLKRSAWRALWHLAVGMVLCAAFITVFRFGGVNDAVSASRAMLREEFGGLSASPVGGLVVEKSPELARSLTFYGGFKLSYVPAGAAELPDDLTRNAAIGVVFSPNRIAMWRAARDLQMILLPRASSGAQMLSWQNYSGEELLRALNTPGEPPENGSYSTAAILVKMLNSDLRGQIALALFFASFLQLLIQTLPVVLLFSLVFSWVGAFRRNGILRFRDVWIITVYASLPAMLVASMFPAWELPFLDFDLVFSLGAVLYAMTACYAVAFGRLTGNGGENG